MEEKKQGWKTLPEGDILEGATSLKFKTGNWRSSRPIYHPDKCIHCLFCWISCPDGAIKVKDGKFERIDYDYCKGCGICAHECPKGAIEMVPEKGGE